MGDDAAEVAEARIGDGLGDRLGVGDDAAEVAEARIGDGLGDGFGDGLDGLGVGHDAAEVAESRIGDDGLGVGEEATADDDADDIKLHIGLSKMATVVCI